MKKELLSEGLLALVVGVDYLVKLCRDGEREERTLPSNKVYYIFLFDPSLNQNCTKIQEVGGV
jgi:hypothetical protein